MASVGLTQQHLGWERAVKSGLSPRRFPVIPMFSLVTGLGLAEMFL